MPTRSDIEAWDVTHLEDAATHWKTTAQRWESHFETIHQGMLRPGGTTWEGAAADAAVESSWADVVKVRGAGDALHAAAGHASTGAGDIAWAKRQTLTAIEEAEAAGFTVGEDLSVTDKSSGALMRTTVARQQQAQAFASEIGSRAQTLAAMDKAVAGRITTALAPVRSLQFEEAPGERAPVMQAAGYRFKQDIEENDQDPLHHRAPETVHPGGTPPNGVDPETGAHVLPGEGEDGAGMRGASGLPPGVGPGWASRTADNGQGTTYQKPGSPGDSNSVRVMDPGADPRYPNGYVKFTNEHNQPVTVDGKPGSRADTHIPRNPDGTFPIPKGWR